MADVNLSQDEERRLQEAFQGFDPNAAGLADTISVSGTKDLFCANWQTVKGVLSFLAGLPLPPPVPSALRTVIAAGDLAYRTLCGGQGS